jgi:hypothetical protein
MFSKRGALFSLLLCGTTAFSDPVRDSSETNVFRKSLTTTVYRVIMDNSSACANDCLSKVDLKGCPTTDNGDCLCKADFNVQAPLFKCVLDSCSTLDAAGAIADYSSVCSPDVNPKPKGVSQIILTRDTFVKMRVEPFRSI